MNIPVRAVYKAHEKFQLVVLSKVQQRPSSSTSSPFLVDDFRGSFTSSAATISLDELNASSGPAGAWENSSSSSSSLSCGAPSVACPLSPSSKRTNKKRVRFDDDVLEFPTLAMADYTEEEKRDTFFSDLEYYCMKVAANELAKTSNMNSSSDNGKNKIISSEHAVIEDHLADTLSLSPSSLSSTSLSSSLRGLENMSPHGRIRLEIRVQAAWAAVLDEQYRQRCDFVYSVQKLAEASQQVTKCSMADAHQRGLHDQDYATVLNLLNETLNKTTTTTTSATSTSGPASASTTAAPLRRRNSRVFLPTRLG